jgi:hypothetical protein
MLQLENVADGSAHVIEVEVTAWCGLVASSARRRIEVDFEFDTACLERIYLPLARQAR